LSVDDGLNMLKRADSLRQEREEGGEEEEEDEERIW
jgi:hypothetical protein